MKTQTVCSLLLGTLLATRALAADTRAEVKHLSVNGGLEDGQARLVIEARLHGLPEDRQQLEKIARHYR